MTFKASDSLAEQIARHLADRIVRGELRPGERIQEQKVTQALDVSRGSVREALLILERRHLVVILPRRGAHVSDLDAHHVRSLCTLMAELYILLGNAVAQGWRTEADLVPFTALRQTLARSAQADDIQAFVDHSFAVMRAAYPFADNPYLRETVENLQPAMNRNYYRALEQRKAVMADYLALFDGLLAAVRQRDTAGIRQQLDAYGQLSCQLVLAALGQP